MSILVWHVALSHIFLTYIITYNKVFMQTNKMPGLSKPGDAYIDRHTGSLLAE